MLLRSLAEHHSVGISVSGSEVTNPGPSKRNGGTFVNKLRGGLGGECQKKQMVYGVPGCGVPKQSKGL